jgi:cell wall-associated NlpC family hydrolase
VRDLLLISAVSLLLSGCFSVRPAPRYTTAKTQQTSVVRELETRKRGGDQRLRRIVGKYIGIPYKWGGTTRSGMDCSAFTRAAFRETYGIELPRTSKQMYQLGRFLPNRQELRPGDLVFFKDTFAGAGISHVGVYLGDGEFAHASSSKGVTITPLNNPYFTKRYAGGRRIER